MLDLTALNDQLYDIRLLDGQELHLRRPTQGMVQFLVDLKDLRSSDMDEMQILQGFAQFFARVLSRNNAGIEFTSEAIADDYDYQTMLYVINDYFDYWNREVGEKVVFQQSQHQAS